MDLLTLIGIGISLSMDAFSVSICKGLTTKRFHLNTALICGLWFGFFQALMPVIGYFVSLHFAKLISTFDHWIAFGLLLIIGANMIRESFNDNDDGSDNGSTKFMTMFVGRGDKYRRLSCRSNIRIYSSRYMVCSNCHRPDNVCLQRLRCYDRQFLRNAFPQICRHHRRLHTHHPRRKNPFGTL